MSALWPEVGEVEPPLIKEADYLTFVSHEFRVRLRKMMDMKGKVCALYIACVYHCVGSV